METIKTPSRLHLSLIDMHGGLGRVDGGVGIALEKPCFEASFEKASGVLGLSGETKKLAEKICSEYALDGINVNIKETLPEHVGFGSKTQTSLGLAAGICKAHGKKYTLTELAKLVGRGGTSGIGVSAFEKGGFIVDGGHGSSKGFSPSRYSNSSAAPIIAQYDFPWWLVCAWPESMGAHGKEEKDIFKKYCPIPKEAVGEVSRIILMKMLPALVENDIESFGQGVNLLQVSGFKKIEVNLQQKEVGELIAYLRKDSAGAGMSSFGPVCFGLCETESEAKSLEQKIKSRFSFNTIYTRANNSGAKWH